MEQHENSLEQEQEKMTNAPEQEKKEGYGDKKLEGPNYPAT
ncbi:hypothetical protein QUF84_15995 [Fictibacillus enclensis]|jgi:hypothetical protein|uniref:Uncharacterized protein n=1 Tax=Fictibacillus solisalsi TaxID=459525 RepID=A0A1G9VVT6_9BACL|nr:MULTISPECIES: hypothetical protein [Fictibacillus]MDM5199477.1 hypothetical protein [Fictibacillus enclensis]MDM5338714.1 hypothetical protein [Fictibacillus enclensis]WHY70212.1 hypothetical protein QNH15_14135 [Fictibacillus enclensis]SCB98573.1 hypothetical protein GA0061096_1811 [Fictibacillus enclensis]SDM76369.1 hypothetical protein SAMN04488137_1827 [Fictibacillus solisalsi]